MARKLIDRPLTFAIPQVGGTAILPQQAALGTVAKIRRTNDGYFVVAVVAAPGATQDAQICVASVSRCEHGGGQGWLVERKTAGTYAKLATFSDRHLRSALGYAVMDTTVEFVIDRDDLER